MSNFEEKQKLIDKNIVLVRQSIIRAEDRFEQIEKSKTIGKFDELKDKLPSLSAENAKEGWQLMNNIATTEEQIARKIN